MLLKRTKEINFNCFKTEYNNILPTKKEYIKEKGIERPPNFILEQCGIKLLRNILINV